MKKRKNGLTRERINSDKKNVKMNEILKLIENILEFKGEAK